MISVVILNWKRPKLMRKAINALRKSKLVSEIIVWNNNPKVRFRARRDVTIINCNRDLGLFTRFAAASLAKNSAILFQDDDVVLQPKMIQTLYKNWKKDPEVCHAAFGRICWTGPYQTRNRWGEVDVVLTTAVLVHARICLRTAINAKLFADLPGSPVGNGEDIILSYTAISMSGRPNKTYPLDLWREYQDPRISISMREPTHMPHRTRVLRRCRKLLGPKKLMRKMAPKQ
jgi:hypothetical protein